jgi:hypothetical protein
MRKTFFLMVCASLVWVLLFGCGPQKQLPEKFEIPLVPSKGYTGDAKGMAVINTKTGTDISITINGLDPKGLYTAFFINVKSQMFEGIDKKPHVLNVSPNGEVNLQATMEKNIYKKFIRVGIFLNSGGKPIQNPLGVKSTLDALIKTEKPTLILEGKLR